MAMTPKFIGPDRVARENYIFSTDVAFRFFHGVIDSDTADMVVSVRGSGFAADPDLIMFEGTTFTIPNPSAYPDGLQLLPGSNRIVVKSILTNGQLTNPGVIEANLALDRDVKAGVTAPSGVRIERLTDAVRVGVTGIDDSNVIGYNFYASSSPGGGLTGYKKINANLITSGTTEEVVESLAELVTDAAVATDNAGAHAADPLYLRVQGTQVNNATTTVQSDFDEIVEVPETASQIRTSFTVSVVDTVETFSFTHSRSAGATSTPATIPYSEFSAVPDTDPLYYAVSAVYVIDDVEYESVLSQEAVGAPIIVTPGVTTLPTVSRQQIVQDTTLSINRSRPEVDVKPGSYTRDTFIDPFSTEAERIRFVIGFLQACQSFQTLLDIDDPTDTGTSIPVNQSPYKVALKQAFYLRDDLSVQNLIDNAFDHLASRRGVTRLLGQRSRGEVTLYRANRPTGVQTIPIGTIILGGGTRVQTTSVARLTPSGAGNYNPRTGRWSTTVFVQAVDVGSAGNLAPGSLRAIQNGPSGVQVVNESALYGGADVESNRELALRSDRALASVDSGTHQGYIRAATGVRGVQQVNVVDAGHPSMVRDLDPGTGQHWGGKVDIWVRPDNSGRSIATLSDTFARFETVIDGQFEPVGSIQDLKFRAVNAEISEDNPLIEMLDLADLGFEFKVISGGGSPRPLSLTGVTILSADTIQLSTVENDPTSIALTDQFRATYRFRSSDKHIFRRQPVGEIVSFYRADGSRVVVSPDAYKLFRPSDPLGVGRSTEADDFIKVVTPMTGTPPVNIPSGDPLEVTGERHVMLSGVEYLNNLGINKYTVKVYSLDRSVEYSGPYSPEAAETDFSFVNEEGEHPVGIVLTTGSAIVNGQSVLVDYFHDENYTVEYTSNALVRVAQDSIDKTRHVTADVLVKEALAVGVDLSATVVVLPNQSTGAVSGLIRTELSRFFGTLGLGSPVRQSDIVRVIENVPGVSYVTLPLVRLSRSEGSPIIRESLLANEAPDWTEITSWASGGVRVYLLTNPLLCGTKNGGGDINEFRGVFWNDVAMTLSENLPLNDGAPLRGVAYSAAIIGNDGASITGYTGETARRVLISLPEDVLPSQGSVAVTYIASEDAGVKNIEPGPTEFLELGDLDMTFDVDTDHAAVLTGRI